MMIGTALVYMSTVAALVALAIFDPKGSGLLCFLITVAGFFAFVMVGESEGEQ